MKNLFKTKRSCHRKIKSSMDKVEHEALDAVNKETIRYGMAALPTPARMIIAINILRNINDIMQYTKLIEDELKDKS